MALPGGVASGSPSAGTGEWMFVLRSDAGHGGAPPPLLLVAPPPVARLTDFSEMLEGAGEKSRAFSTHYRRVAEDRGCAFLDDEGACRIYADRPSVCRSQGLPLRVLFEDERGEIAERRDVCPLNLEGLPALDRLSEEDCWLVGPYELRLAALDARFSGRPPEDDGETTRVALRSLFSSTPESVPPTTPR